MSVTVSDCKKLFRGEMKITHFLDIATNLFVCRVNVRLFRSIKSLQPNANICINSNTTEIYFFFYKPKNPPCKIHHIQKWKREI